MKVCVPTRGSGGLDDHVSEHFGRAQTYTVVDRGSGKVTVIVNKSDHMGGTGKPPEQIKSSGSSIVLCSGLGPNAIAMLRSYGMEVYVGASGTAKEAVGQFERGELRAATEESACHEHKH